MTIKLINTTDESTITTEFEEVELIETVARIRDFLIASGYHPENVAEYLGLEGTCYAWYNNSADWDNTYDSDI